MGIKYFDKDTIGHFCGGVLSYTMLQYSNVPVTLNFVIANGIHYMIEKTERSVAPNGRVLGTYENHIGDIIAFLLGWIVGFALRSERYVNHKIAPVLWIILIYNYSAEILREIYPYERLLDGAYMKDA
ncbi:MAG: hypothetical protein FJX80_02035 [Bacteroidetes bacterium]|nr:hypothetical protein [Bacteroidota bacterium]